MKCPYEETECIHFGRDEECDINTCYDEYDMAKGIPCPDLDTKDYWERLEKYAEEIKKKA